VQPTSPRGWGPILDRSPSCPVGSAKPEVLSSELYVKWRRSTRRRLYWSIADALRATCLNVQRRGWIDTLHVQSVGCPRTPPLDPVLIRR
jgi:hypothetical protein